MDKMKDFFYNKNDIVIALIILVVAAAVIYFRIQAIMEYPAALAESQANQTRNTQQEEPTKAQPQ